MRFIAAWCLAVLALAVAAGADAEERRVALVIGNGAYEHVSTLPNPPHDAAALAATLRRLGFEVIEETDLDFAEMWRAIDRFGDALAGAAVGLFFYAGHGLQVGGQNYLVPTNAALRRESSLNYEAVPVATVQRVMERAERTNLILLDACRDNPLAQELARSMGATRSASVGSGLAEMQTGIGTLVVYATAPGMVALDGTGEHSPFTQALLEHVTEPGLEVRQMLTRVRLSVIDRTDHGQVPWDHSSLTGDFYFVPPAVKAEAAPVPAPAPAAPRPEDIADETEIVFWKSVARQNSPELLRVYLATYPNGAFAPLAQAMLRTHEEATAPAAPPPAAAPAASEPALAADRIRQLQGWLNALGHDAGPADGVAGPRTRAAAAAYSRRHGLPGDDALSLALYEHVAAAAAALPPPSRPARPTTPAATVQAPAVPAVTRRAPDVVVAAPSPSGRSQCLAEARSGFDTCMQGCNFLGGSGSFGDDSCAGNCRYGRDQRTRQCDRLSP